MFYCFSLWTKYEEDTILEKSPSYSNINTSLLGDVGTETNLHGQAISH